MQTLLITLLLMMLTANMIIYTVMDSTIMPMKSHMVNLLALMMYMLPFLMEQLLFLRINILDL